MDAAGRAASAEQLAAELVANDTALRAAIDAWRADEDPPSAEPPAEVMDGSRYLQETVRTLARRRGLARNVLDAASHAALGPGPEA